MILTSGKRISISTRGLLFAACALFLCTLHENSAMAADKSPGCSIEPVDARGGSFSFSWEQVVQGDAFLSLRNNSAADQAVTVGLAGVTKPQPGPPVEALSIEPDSSVTKGKDNKFTVPRQGAILFHLKEAGTPPFPVPPSGSYATQLLLGSPCDRPPSKPTAITITVGKVQPVIPKLSLMVLRPNPWSSPWTATVDAPVRRRSGYRDMDWDEE